MSERPDQSPDAHATSWVTRYGGPVANMVISVLLAALGWFAVQFREIVWPRVGDQVLAWQDMGMDSWQSFSFDLPFLLRTSLPDWLTDLAAPARSPHRVVLLQMDLESEQRLQQSPHKPWNRKLHAQLLDRLATEKSGAVLFDLSFDTETPEDGEFAQAIKRHGNVFLGAALDTNDPPGLTRDAATRRPDVGLATEKLLQPNRTLKSAAKGWGLLDFQPIESDNGVRRLFTGILREGFDPWEVATWKIAKSLGAPLPKGYDAHLARRWVNFYGPGRIPGISYHRVLDEKEGGVLPGYFQNKIVVIGGKSPLGVSAQTRRDEFGTPWSRYLGRAFTPGAEIHATILLNLLEKEWIMRVPVADEIWLVVLLGLALGALRWLQPWRALAVTLAAMLFILAASTLLQWHALLWWNWAVPVFLQLPVGFTLAIASRYYLEERQRRKLRQAFGLYLSPELATEIADRNFTLKPGGEKVEATVLFTDLEGFTTLSEKLGDSARLGHVLQDYFTRTTDEILAQHGTVIKFIGDSVFAAWGAPLPQEDHPGMAVRAAWRLAQVAQLEVTIGQRDGTSSTMRVRTRIGIHTGEALAGNLGSARRFDYTLIGETVNVASRLEGANRLLGTTILLSDHTARRLFGKFLLRRLGAFKVKGSDHTTIVHELLGEDPSTQPYWLESFEVALQAWEKGDLAAAQSGFEATRTARGGVDGPSQFYLGQIGNAVVCPSWTGEITLSEK